MQREGGGGGGADTHADRQTDMQIQVERELDKTLDKLKARDFNATSLSTYDFSTLCTTLPHHLIKYKLFDLI